MSELSDLEKSIKGVEKAEGEVRAAIKRLRSAESELGTAQAEALKMLEAYDVAHKRMVKHLPKVVPTFLQGQRIKLPKDKHRDRPINIASNLGAIIEFV